MQSNRWVGTSVPRVDGKAKVRGSLKFPSDVQAADMLVCKPVFAPHPHARILEIDGEEASQLPGVVRVLTHKDVPGENLYGFLNDRPLLCDEKTRYAGDMIAVVVAEDEESAQLGVQAVKVNWEPLPLVLDPEMALLEDAPQVHPGGNILHEIHYEKGNVEEIFSDPEVIIIENSYFPQMMDHAFLELEAGVAFPEDGGVKVVSGAQVPYADQMWLSKCLELPMEKSRLIEPYSGGAFGGRGDISVQLVIALAALVTDRPCRMGWSRQEHFRAGPKRHRCEIRSRLAATPEGDFLAHEVWIMVDTGAYALFGDSILETIAENITGLYRFPNVKMDAWSVLTNNPICGAFRGFGAPQGCLALEGQVSRLADRLGKDQIELRLQNLLEQGETAGMGHELILKTGVKEALTTAGHHPLWADQEEKSRDQGHLRRGVGMALAAKGYSLGTNQAPDFSAADIVLQGNGRFLLTTGIVEIGQGSFTTLVQMAAETLNCGPEFFDIDAADTVYHPDSGTTAASRVTYAVGLAAVDAAQKMNHRLRLLASYKWEISSEEVEIKDGFLWNTLTGETLSLADISKLEGRTIKTEARLRVPYSDHDSEGGLAQPHVLYSSNVQIALVAVDEETGEVTVEKVVTFPEAGRVINPQGLEGQCEGGIVQGMAYALMEEVQVRDGLVVNDNFSVYPIPTSLDVPEIEVIPVEVPEASGPFGAKGAAENTTVPTAPAILDAIYDAVGLRFAKLPVTPERMLFGLDELET